MTNDERPPFDIRHSGFVIDSSFWFRHSGLIALGLLLVVAATLRIHRAGQTGLIFDEIWHLGLSTGNGSPQMSMPSDRLIASAPSPTSLADAKPVWRVWANMDRCLHPPLYFVALHLWRNVWGPGDFAAHGLAICCSLISLVLLYDWANRSFGRSVALFACALFALAPMAIFLHQQVRGYAMLQMFGLAAINAMARIDILGFSRRRGLALGAATLGMMLTHYFAFGAALMLGLYALFLLRGKSRWQTAGCLIATLVIFTIIWGPFIGPQIKDLAATGDTFLKEDRSDHVTETFARLARLPALQLFDLPQNLAGWVWPVCGAVLLLCVCAAKKRAARLPLIFLAGTFGFVTLLDLARSTQHLLFIRYTALGFPAMLALALVGLQQLHRFALWAGCASLLLTCGMVIGTASPIREEPGHWANLAQYLRQHVRADDPILFSSGEWASFYNQSLYLGTAHYSDLFPHSMVMMSHPMGEQLRQQLYGKTVWLVMPPPAKPEVWMPGTTVLQAHELPPFAWCYEIRVSSPERLLP